MWLCKNIKEEKGVNDGQVSQQLKQWVLDARLHEEQK